MKLAIISHTEHFITDKGEIVGWGPTITEINHLLQIFDKIYHLAMLSEDVAPKHALPYLSPNISFISIPNVGGKKLSDKLAILLSAPKTVGIVRNYLKMVDFFQFRAPTGIGAYLIPYIIFFSNKDGWFKYAGNWNQINPPTNYRFQKWLLKKQSKIVTINGQWKDQPQQCLSFKNPCLNESEILDAKDFSKLRIKPLKWSLCFVGRLEKEKGVDLIFEALSSLNNQDLERINEINFVGEGKNEEHYKNLASNFSININFHGFLPREEVMKIYKISDILLLPSQSEGFPKVISESMAFGCIPIVSDVSCISQYIDHKVNGLLLKYLSGIYIKNALVYLLNLSSDRYKKLIDNGTKNVSRYSYAHYNERILNEVLKSNP